MDKKISVRPGAKVKIEISKKRSGGSRSTKAVPLTKKGIIRSRRTPDYLPRRLNKGGLRFFDLGRLANGDEIQFVIQSVFLQTDMGESVPIPIPDLSDFTERDEFLFNLTEDNNFETVFFEITKPDSNLYNLTIVTDLEFTEYEVLRSDSALWKPNGIGITKPEILSLIGVANNDGTPTSGYRIELFDGIIFGLIEDVYYIKTTSVYDFDADGIENFNLNASDKVFLMPTLASVTAESTFVLGGLLRQRYLNYDLRFGLRNYYIPDQNPAVNPAYSDANQFDPIEEYEIAYAAIQIHAALTDARCYERHYEDEESEATVWETVADPFDITSDPPFTYNYPDSNPYSVKCEYLNYGAVTGTLLAIVKRGNNLFYIWQT